MQTPSHSTVVGSYHQLEGQVATLQRAIKSASAVLLALQALKEVTAGAKKICQVIAKARWK
jgi:hypothetical protein